MAQPLLQAPPSNWEDQFPAIEDTTPAANWEDQFPADIPAPAENWEDQFPADTQATDNWEDQFPAIDSQTPLDTFSRSAALGVGTSATGAVTGTGTLVEDLSAAADQLVPGLGRVVPYLGPVPFIASQTAGIAQDIATEAERLYAPDTQANPTAATLGSGVGQALGMIPTALAGGTPLVLGSAAAQGYGEGSQTAADLGVTSPAGRIAAGTAFGVAETLVERLGGLGSGPVKAAGQEILESLGKRTLKTIGSEFIEEPITGVLQDETSLNVAKAVEDPNRPDFTINGQPIAPFLPTSPEYWARRRQEAIGGAAGGTVFAGLGLLANRQRPAADQAATPPPLPTPAAPTITLNGQAYTYNPTELTPDALQTIAATGNLQDYLDAGMVQNATPQTPPPPPGTPDPGTLGPPPPPVVAPSGPTVQEARETLGTLGNVGTRAAPATTVGRAGPAPLPRDPDGNLDLLNYLNENPIRAPRRGTEGAAAAEYDWRESGDFDPAFRTRIMQEGAPNIDQRAQEAYDLGFIPAPTPEALAAEVRSVIAKRQQQRRQGPAQARVMDEMERTQVQFEQTQTAMAGRGQPVNLDDLAPGDTLRIDGQLITVADIDYDEDGYTTRALLRTPTGTVRITPESNLRADRTVKESLSVAPTLEDINAQLALAAEANTGFTNTTIVARRPDGSTILYPELVDLAARALQAGTRFTTWAANLVKQFGQSIKQYLAGAWQAARNTSQVGARANLNPNARISARPPTMAEAIEGQTRQSQFGERVQADDRLTDPLRAAPVSTFAVQTQQDALDAANRLIRDLGLDAATATFTTDATLPTPVRIAGLMQSALQYDARAALAQRQNNPTASATADAATAAAIEAKAALEIIGNDTGRNLAMFATWARMSPDGQLRRLDKQFATAARDTIRGDTGVTPEEVNTLVTEEINAPAIDDLIEQILLEGETPTPVNLRTGAPIARRSLLDTFLGGLETTALAISESTTIQRTVEAIDNVLKALSGKLFADPLLLTPIGQAVLKTTRTLLLQGTKLTQAIADAIAVVRTRTPIPAQDIAPLTQAVTAAVVKEVIKPALRKLAFDTNYKKKDAVKDLLSIGIGIMEAGRLADAVIAKRPTILKSAQAKVRAAVMRRLSDKPRKRSRAQKLPAIIDTLVEAAGAGFLNERKFLAAWDKKFPIPKLEDADRQRLRQMAAAVNLLPEGILRQAEAIKFQNEVALIKGIPAVDALTSAWYANLLAGASTQAVNVWGNGLNLFFRTAAVGLGSPADITKLFQGLAAGVRPGLREAKEVLKTGQLLKVNQMGDMQAAGALELMAQQGRPIGFRQWLAYLISVGGLTRYVFRAMGAMDAVFWYSAQEGMAHLAASRTLRKAQGLKPGTAAFNAAFLRELGGDETQYLADIDQARTELTTAGVPVTPGAVNRRAWEIRAQRRTLANRDASVRWADRNVMQQPPEGIGRAISKIITVLQNVRPLGVPVFVPLVPFNRILSNLFESSLDWAGVGILRGVLGYHLTDFNKTDKRLFDTVERRERFMAGMLGMSVAGTFLAAAMAIKDQDDEEIPFMVYAMGPPDPTRKGTMPKGWRPYSMKINGQYVSFAESPMGPLLGAVGAIMDSIRYGNADDKSWTDRGMIAFHQGLSSFMSMGVMSSISDVVGLWNKQGSLAATKQAALAPVAGFIPAQGLLRDMAPLFDDRKISNADVLGALVKDIPVLKAYGKPALNVLGEEIKTEGLPVVRRFVTGQRPDANIAFIQKHQLRITALDRTIEIGQYLPKRERTALGLEDSDRRRALGMIALENGVMTPDQQYQFTKAQGEAIKGGLERLRKSTANIPPSPQATDAFQKQLNAITEAARITAMRQLVSELR